MIGNHEVRMGFTDPQQALGSRSGQADPREKLLQELEEIVAAALVGFDEKQVQPGGVLLDLRSPVGRLVPHRHSG